MSIKEQVSKIFEPIRKIEMEAELKSSIQALDAEAQALADNDDGRVGVKSLIVKAKQLEDRLAKKYPAAANLIGELIEALAKAGS